MLLSGGGQFRRDLHHLRHRVAEEEVVGGDLVDPPHAAEQLQHPAHVRFGRIEQTGNIAHARRTESLGPGDQRPDLVPQRLVRRRQAHRVTGQLHPGAVEGDFLLPLQDLQHRRKGRRRQPRLQLQAQPFEPDAVRSGFSAWNCASVASSARLSRSHWRATGRASSCRSQSRSARALTSASTSSGDSARSRQKVARSTKLGDRSSSVVSAARDRKSHAPRAAPAVPGCAAVARGAQIEQPAAADRPPGAGVANDNDRRPSQRSAAPDELNGTPRRRPDRFVAKRHDPRADLRGGVMQPNRRPLPDRLLLGGQHTEHRVDPVGRRVQYGIEHEIDRARSPPWRYRLRRD